MTETQPQADPVPAPAQDKQSEHDEQKQRGEPNPRAVISPLGLIRAVTWVCALLTFALASSTPYYPSTGWLSGLIAFGVLLWIWCMFIIFITIILPMVDASFKKPVYLISLIIDVCFIVWAVVNLLVGMIRCGSDHHEYCVYFGTSIASIVFGCFCLVLEVLAILLSVFQSKVKDKQEQQ